MKIIFKTIASFLLITFLAIVYLSFVGIETQKFNNQISEKIKKINKKLDVELNSIQIILDPFNLRINAKTIGPKLTYEKKIIDIENIKTKISLKALLNDQFSLKNLEISTKSLDLPNTISFIRSVNNTPEFYILEKIIKGGFLIADIKLEFDKTGKIKKNYKIDGFIKDGKLNVVDTYKLDKLNFTFSSEKNTLKLRDINFLLNNLNLYSNNVSIKNLKKAFFIEGEINHNKLDLDTNDLGLFFPDLKNFNIKKLELSSNNTFSFNLSKKMKLKNLVVLSKIKLDNLTLLNKLNFKNFFPNNKKLISFLNNEIQVKYKDKNLIINGKGGVLIQEKIDKISYNLKTINENIQFECSMIIQKNPLIMNIFNYENKKNIVEVNIKGNSKKDKEININNFSLKERNNTLSLKDLKLNTDLKILELKKANLDLIDKDGFKNSFIFQKKNKDYVLKGTSLNIKKIIDLALEDEEKKSNFLNMAGKVDIIFDKVNLDNNNYLNDFQGSIFFKKQKITQARLEGNFTDNQKFKFTINSDNGTSITTLFTDRAEPLIKRYKFIKGFGEGSLDFYSSTSDNKTMSTLKVYDFKLKELPALTKVLTLASLQGIADTLSGEGIRFDEFEMSFKSNKSLITIDEIYAIGPAISVLMEGYIEKDKLISLRGTLVPATTINKFIGSLPVLGDILVGSKVGEGVFGVSFKIKGPPKNLETTVNPIKTLTPRFITRTLEKIKKN